MAEKKSGAYSAGAKTRDVVGSVIASLPGILARNVPGAAGTVAAASGATAALPSAGDFFRGLVGAQPATAVPVSTVNPTVRRSYEQAAAGRGWAAAPGYEVVMGPNGKAVAGTKQVAFSNAPARGAPISAADLDAQQDFTPPQAVQATPTDRLNAFLQAAMSMPQSVASMQGVTAMIPKQALPKQPTAKDSLLGQAALISQGQYAQDLKDAADDPAKASKAVDAYFRRQATLLGSNPMNVSLADLIDQQEQ